MLGTALAYMVLALFIARISLAAAIAAGEASFGVCAPAGTPVKANPHARQAAGKILERHFIAVLLDYGLRPFNNANSLRPRKHCHADQTDKQPVLDNARYLGQRPRQPGGIGYSSQMGIDNPVATIGDKSMAIPAVSDPHLPGNAA